MIDVFGLDLSLTSTGLSGAGKQYRIMSGNTGPQRLIDITQSILNTLSENDQPGVVVEGYSFGSRNSQAHSIGELGGVVRVELWKQNIPFVVIPPTVRAKFATGKGNASKMEVVSAVSARTGLTWQGGGADDMCDAWILEEMGLAALGRPRFEWPSNHLESLGKIDWLLLRTADESQ